jgi:hypothetical protein
LGNFPKTVIVTSKHTGRVMRISDDRYNRERSSLDLALKFLRHEARTQTIRAWTGLTDDRIRNLYRSHISRGHDVKSTCDAVDSPADIVKRMQRQGVITVRALRAIRIDPIPTDC